MVILTMIVLFRFVMDTMLQILEYALILTERVLDQALVLVILDILDCNVKLQFALVYQQQIICHVPTVMEHA